MKKEKTSELDNVKSFGGKDYPILCNINIFA